MLRSDFYHHRIWDRDQYWSRLDPSSSSTVGWRITGVWSFPLLTFSPPSEEEASWVGRARPSLHLAEGQPQVSSHHWPSSPGGGFPLRNQRWGWRRRCNPPAYFIPLLLPHLYHHSGHCPLPAIEWCFTWNWSPNDGGCWPTMFCS